MNTFTIVGLVISFTLFLFLTQFYLKRRFNIHKWKGLTFKERNKYSVAAEFIIVFLFIYSSFCLNVESMNSAYSPIVRTSPMFGLFFLFGIKRGFEEWLLNRNQKVYYYEWLGSLLIIVAFFIIFIGER